MNFKTGSKAEDRLEPQLMKSYRQIESEGDGMRSYVGICIALLLGRRPVCLIDEPELCLHPPQANAMGRFIGNYGTSAEHLTLASTHSSHVLRGVIEATEQVQILRLSKAGDNFKGHLIGRDILVECLRRPIVRAETILDGIFADGVTIVEADGDRAVYQAAWDALKNQNRQSANSGEEYLYRDMLFIPVGGTGGVSDIAKFYRALRIPVTAIADLDLIMDRNKMQSILSVLTDTNTANDILSKCYQSADLIKKIPPSISESEFKTRLQNLAQSSNSWEADDDRRLKSDLNRLANDIDRMRRLKSGGVSQFKDDAVLYELISAVIQKCSDCGLFLVPVGELEYWSPSLDVQASKSKKSEWANEAAMKLRKSPDLASDLLGFMRSIAVFQLEAGKRLA